MVDVTPNDFIWATKYRPKTIDDCVLPVNVKKDIKNFIKQGEIPHFLLSGPPGCGKTTVAYAIAHELGADLLYINASMDSGIDTLRTTIQSFASTVSLSDSGHKIVLLDEADGTSGSFQNGLKGFLEAFGRNCRFIFTVNHKNKIIDPIHSRCTKIHFSIDADEKAKLASTFMKRVVNILKEENVEYDPKAVAGVIGKSFPDFRGILNILQNYASGGSIDMGILIDLSEEAFSDLYKSMKNKNFGEVKKWVAKNASIDDSTLYRNLYDRGHNFLTKESIPQMILIIADYQFKAGFVADKEINTTACLIELMANCQFGE